MRYKHYMALRWAVTMAQDWRGSIVGNPDTTQLDAFDKQIKRCREALKEIPRDPKGAKK